MIRSEMCRSGIAGLLALLLVPAIAPAPVDADPKRSEFLVTAPPLEDLDGDGAFDVFEDLNRNGRLDAGEDFDGDGRLTPPGGCEGRWREDVDCDGRIDLTNEDFNGNGVLDPGEDVDADGRLDPGTEDRNDDNAINDRPFPAFDDSIVGESGSLDPLYPYASLRPAAGGLMVTQVGADGTVCQCVTATPVRPWADLIEDTDGDGLYDVFEDFIIHNGQLDPGEDLDGDGRLTPPGGCEGAGREDVDCDGHLDLVNEDRNGNGSLDPGEDVDADGRLDPGTEDRNGDQFLNDRPLVTLGDRLLDESGATNPLYPYGTSQPGLDGKFKSLAREAACDCGVIF